MNTGTLAGRSGAGRMTRLHLASRRIPAAIGALAACGIALQLAIRAGDGSGPGTSTGTMQLVLAIEVGVAAVVGAAIAGPFGESERTAAGRRLPLLRMITLLALAAAAAGVMLAGAAGVDVPNGDLAILRDTAGLTGIALICATAVGGAFAWVGPAAYFVIAAYAVAANWSTPWTWPARPPGDTGAMICAIATFAVGALLVVVIGTRDRSMP
jgi:hypothetical protein